MHEILAVHLYTRYKLVSCTRTLPPQRWMYCITSAGKGGSGHCCTVSVAQRNACGWGMRTAACGVVTRFADSALFLPQTCTSYDNHTLISTPGEFKFSNHYPSLNLIGHIHIPTCATETVQQWPDPPFPALVMQYIQSWGGEWSGTWD